MLAAALILALVALALGGLLGAPQARGQGADLPPVQKLRAVSMTPTDLVLNWEGVQGASGYRVYLSRSAFTDTLQTSPFSITPQTYLTIHELTPEETYYVAVVPYREADDPSVLDPVDRENTIKVTLPAVPSAPEKESNIGLYSILAAVGLMIAMGVLAGASWVRQRRQMRRIKDIIGDRKNLHFECPWCNLPVGIDDIECPNCHARFETVETRCSVCRAPMKKTQTLCRRCGTDYSKDAIEKYFTDPEVAEEYAAMLAMTRKRRYRPALVAVDKLIKAHPGNAVLWNDRGYILKALGRRNDARKAFEAALDADPDYEIAQRNLKRLGPEE